MNILVISNIPLNPGLGSGYIICGFAEGLKEHGHQVNAFGPDDFIIFPKTRAAKRLRLFIGYTLKAICETWYNKSSYDIVELWGGVGWLSCLILSRFRFGSYKVISRSNGLEPQYRIALSATENSPFHKSLIGKFHSLTDSVGFRSADTLTVVSQYDQDFAIKHNFQKSSRVLLLENALSHDWLNQEVYKRKNFTIGFVGTWINRKGNKQLVDVINSLTVMGCLCNWKIIGVGNEGKNYLLKHTNLQSSSIYVQKSRSELKEIYQEVSVLLCLSSYESFGLICSEAMSCGCMLMSTKVGFVSGLRESLDYICIDRCNTLDIAIKFFQIIHGYLDHGLIAENGYKQVQKLNWQSNIIKLERHYRDLILDIV